MHFKLVIRNRTRCGDELLINHQSVGHDAHTALTYLLIRVPVTSSLYTTTENHAHAQREESEKRPANPWHDLTALDYDIDEHIDICTEATTKGLRSPVRSVPAKDAVRILETEQEWFRKAQRTVCDIGEGTCDPKIVILRDAMTARLSTQLMALDNLLGELSGAQVPTSAPRYFRAHTPRGGARF